MERVLRYICDHIREPLDLHAVAEYAGYSVWHFCSKFKRYTGMTFVEYLRNRRVQLAAMDLQRGASITDVALKYGYDSVSGFERAFLKSFRCSPSAFLKDVERYRRAYEDRRKNSLPLSDRCMILLEETVQIQTQDEALIGQYRYHMDMCRAALGNRLDGDPGLVRAKCLSAVIRGYAPVIFDGELIVGNNYGRDWVRSREVNLFALEIPFGSEGWEEQVRAYLCRGTLTREQIDALIDAQKHPMARLPGFEHDVTLEDRVRPEERFLYEEFAARGKCMAYTHTILNYEKVLKYGFSGLLEQMRSLRAGRGTLTDAERRFYDGTEEILEAACTMGRRFADAAEALAESAGGDRAQELRQVARVCRQVPEYPARTFQEAVQSLWFAHIINTWEDDVNSNSLGRIDQILYPYYVREIDEGTLTRERAFELICCLFLKLYRDYDVQQSTIGGCDREGRCAVNDLSYLMLDAMEALDFVRCMSVRVSSDMPRDFLQRALEVVSHIQKGVPSFYNDDVFIDALVQRGIPVEDARDYAPLGGVEICIPGKANPHAVSGQINLLKALEYALGDGTSFCQDAVPSIHTGDPAKFRTFEELKCAVIAQMHHLIDVTCAQINRDIPYSCRNDGVFYKSILTDGCLERGRHFNDGGPLYNYYQVMLMGLPNLADSLEVIRRFVYEEQRYTLPELVDILRRDYPDEEVRQDFINHAAKFGNDQPSVDALAAEMMTEACDYMASIPSAIGEGFHAQLFSYTWMYQCGWMSGASADGRRHGEALASDVSPMQGADFKGLTATLNSLTALPTRKAPGSACAVVEVEPFLFSDKNIDVMTDAMLTAIGRGLSNLRFNTVSREILLDAQQNPEKYRNLAVSVTGFSQKFVTLNKDMQEHIISRTKHVLL